MPKNGQAKVLSNEELDNVFANIEQHRHPEKNALIIQLSFKLGLRVQEMSMLRITEVAELGSQYPLGYQIKENLNLPKKFTKGARTIKKRTSVSYTVAEFYSLVKKIRRDALNGKEIDIDKYYPELKSPGGEPRKLALTDSALKAAITRYLNVRMGHERQLKAHDVLLRSQKRGDDGRYSYDPNTLQQHITKMLRKWSKISEATSHSGRRTLATNLLHDEGQPIKTVQKILGHKNASTTAIYHEVTDKDVEKALSIGGKSYEKNKIRS